MARIKGAMDTIMAILMIRRNFMVFQASSFGKNKYFY